MEYIDKYVWYQEGPGVRKNQYTSEGIKLLNVANLVNGKLDLSTSERYISFEEAKGKYKHFLVDEGDLIIASSGIQVEYFDKKMGFAQKEHLPLCMNTSTIRFKALDDKETNIKYFMWFLKSEEFKRQLRKLITGSAQLNFGPSHLKKIKINMPKLTEQNKMVQQLEKVQEIINIREKQIEELDELIKSQFVEMFGDVNNSNYEIKTLEEIVDKNNKYSLKRGPFGGSLKKDDFVTEGYLVYEQRHAIHNDFEYEKYYIDEEKYNNMEMFKVVPGDLIVSCSGVTLGRIAKIPEKAKAGIINQALLKISLDKKIINNEFFIQQFRSDEIQNCLFGFSRGSGIPNFPSMNEVKKLKFICPSITEQLKYEKIVKKIDKQKFEIQKSLEETEELMESLMNKYFG